MIRFIVLSLVILNLSHGCQDNEPKYACDNFKISGYCRTHKWVKQQCQVTCGLCDPNCFDVYGESYCNILKLSCHLSLRVRKNCRKTCGKCVSVTVQPLTTSTPTTALPGLCQDIRPWLECDNFKRSGYCKTLKFVQTNCRQMCGLCGITTQTTTGTAGNDQCGTTKVKTGRIISGTDAKNGQWPWQVAMIINGILSCGGSLVSPLWVVTAAHCLKNIGKHPILSVTLGANDLGNASGHEQIITVNKSITHPLHSMRFDYDIAILKLSTPAFLNNHVNTVCLPNQGEHVTAGTNCYVSGWGKVKHPGGMVPKLQHAKITVISNKECENKNKIYAPITDRMVCAQNNGTSKQSGCHGDSGGPLVCQENNSQWKLHGLVSWGSPTCNVSEASTVFARISALKSWINDQMMQN